jgi:oligosaccharide repeat unit polymerase
MSRWIAAFCVAALVGAGVAIVQVPSSAGDSWLVILWAAWVVAVVWVLTRPSFSVLFAAIMAAMFLFVILPATEAQLFGLTIIAGNDYKGGVVRGLQIAALAQCGMLAGAVAARTFWPVPGFVRVFPQLSPASLGRAVRWSVLVGVLAVLAFSRLGGASLRSFFVYTTADGYGEFAREATGNLGYLAALQSAAGLALVLLPLRLGGSAASRRSALFFAALASLVLVGGGERGRFFVPVFAAGLIWLKTSKRTRPPRRVAAVGLLTLLVLGGFVGTARGAAASRHVSVGTVIAQPFGSGNDIFLPLAGLAETVPGQLPYLHGTSYLEAAAFLVPRGLWKGKPQGAIVDVTTAIDPGNSGIAFPEFGEMYTNFGMPGVVLGSLLFGALIELLARRFFRSTSVGETVFAAVCGAILLDVFTRGAVAPMLISFAGLFAATALICRRRSRVLAATPAPVAAAPPQALRSSRPGGPEPTRRRAASP